MHMKWMEVTTRNRVIVDRVNVDGLNAVGNEDTTDGVTVIYDSRR